MKYLLAAAYVGALGLGACRLPENMETTSSTSVTASAIRTNEPKATMQVQLSTEASLHIEGSVDAEGRTNSASTSTKITPIESTADFILTPYPVNYILEQIADGFNRPLYLTHAGDGSRRLFVVEQSGVIWIIKDGKTTPRPFLDISGSVGHRAPEQGLLGLAFHPNYGRNGYLFVHYSDRKGNTVVQRFVVSSDPNQADPGSGVNVLKQSQPYRNHNGGQISFGPDGYLYVGLGDGGSAGDPQDNGQNPLTWLGAILRVDVSHPPGFAVPPDNPFLSNEAAAPEIWVYGLRNPWRFSFDRLTGDLYIGDVGQNDWEEINFQHSRSLGAENYGWGRMEGDHCYQTVCEHEGYVAPIAEYHHSDGGCSVTGGYVYRGEKLKNLQGIYMYGDYCSGSIWALHQTAPGEWINSPLIESGLKISSFGEDELGEIYVVDHSGVIFRLGHALVP